MIRVDSSYPVSELFEVSLMSLWWGSKSKMAMLLGVAIFGNGQTHE